MTDSANRLDVARWVQQYLAGALSFEQLFALVPERHEDEHVAELLDLIEHEPKQGGFLGVRPAEYDRHMGRIRELIAVLVGGDG